MKKEKRFNVEEHQTLDGRIIDVFPISHRYIHDLEQQLENYKKLGFKYLQDKNNNLETQQKEFIEWLEDEIQKKRKKVTTLTSFKKNVVPLKHCLQKYKEIIGENDV